MAETTIVRSVRMPASHWAFVVARAKQLEINPNAWMTRMVRKQMDRREVMPNEQSNRIAETRPAHPKTPAPAAQPLGELVGQTPVQSVHFGPQTPKPGSRLKKR